MLGDRLSLSRSLRTSFSRIFRGEAGGVGIASSSISVFGYDNGNFRNHTRKFVDLASYDDSSETLATLRNFLRCILILVLVYGTIDP